MWNIKNKIFIKIKGCKFRYIIYSKLSSTNLFSLREKIEKHHVSPTTTFVRQFFFTVIFFCFVYCVSYYTNIPVMALISIDLAPAV